MKFEQTLINFNRLIVILRNTLFEIKILLIKRGHLFKELKVKFYTNLALHISSGIFICTEFLPIS